MPIVVVGGDASTTTSAAVAATWAERDEVVVVEADPSGGDLAAWFGIPASPSLSTVVTGVVEPAWSDVEPFVRPTGTGIRLVPAPARSIEAAQAVVQSARLVAPTLGRCASPITIADAGRSGLSPTSNPFVIEAAVKIVVHRQATQSPAAAAVRLRRLAEQLELSSASPAPIAVAVVGDAPFGLDEISRLVGEVTGSIAVVGLPIDDLTAAVLGGRVGVSARRLARLPLMRAARRLADVVHRLLEPSSGRPSDIAEPTA